MHVQVLSDQVFERLSSVLESNSLGHFSGLPSAEQIVLVEQAYRELMAEDNEAREYFREGLQWV